MSGEHRVQDESIAAPTYWQPPAIEPVFNPEQPDRVFLHFPDIPEGGDQDFDMLVASRFFTHFAFTLWNASQVGSDYLTRATDVQARGIWLFADSGSRSDIAEQVTALIERYDRARDTDDEYTRFRVAYIVDETRKRMARLALNNQ